MQGQARLAAGRSERGATPFSRSHTLDFLRGLAILGVIAIHVSQSFPSNIHAIDYAFMKNPSSFEDRCSAEHPSTLLYLLARPTMGQVLE